MFYQIIMKPNKKSKIKKWNAELEVMKYIQGCI